MTEHVFLSHSPADTFELGRRLGQLLAGGEVIALCGELGAGKTTLVQGLAVGLGIAARVTSPTFTLVNEYQGSDDRRLFHIDLYRLGGRSDDALVESATFGLSDLLDGLGPAEDDGGRPIVAVEWAERATPLLPDDYLAVNLAHVHDSGQAREIRCIAHGPLSQAVLEKLVDEVSPDAA